MKFWKALTIVLILTSPPCLAEQAKIGSYIVAKGAVVDCETWTDRILDIVEIESEQPVDILGLRGLNVLGLSDSEIGELILDMVESETGNRPQTLSISVMHSEEKYWELLEQYLISLTMLNRGDCPSPGHEHPHEYMEEMIEKIRRANLSRSVG